MQSSRGRATKVKFMSQKDAFDYSLILPVKDEEESLQALIEEIEQAMLGLSNRWELIAIDDGSIDGSGSLLKDMAQSKSYLRVATLDRNYGQSTAFAAGFDLARGTWIITMDADGQNDPADIPQLIELSASHDLVCGIRRRRQDTLSKRWISYLSNAVRSRLCHDGVSDTGCSLKLIKREAIRELPWFHGAHRFIPALFVMKGFKIAQVPVNHRARSKGVSKYSIFNRSLGPMIDLLGMTWLQRRRINYHFQEENSP